MDRIYLVNLAAGMTPALYGSLRGVTLDIECSFREAQTMALTTTGPPARCIQTQLLASANTIVMRICTGLVETSSLVKVVMDV